MALLLRERGRLVSKERFMEEVWHGVPVTDEALTQCIRSLRRQLGDEAARPRFIETVPKHGYRFTAEAEWQGAAEAAAPAAQSPSSGWRRFGRTAAASGLGGAAAGIGGGLLYGLAASPPSPAETVGAISALLVLLAISVSLGFAAGLGVGTGIAAADRLPIGGWPASLAGGLLGGFVIGGVTKLLGLDAFALLFGRPQLGMTGPAEGALLGAALGLAAGLARERRLPWGRSAALGGLAGLAAGLLVALCGGRLLGGSLDLLAQAFPDARFRLDAIGALLGEQGFGPLSQGATAAIEGALFGLCVNAALALARERERADGGQPFRPSQ